MLTQDQNTIIYLMFLNGILLLGLNFIAYSLVFPGPRGSKRFGYMLIVSAILAVVVQQEYRTLIHLGFPEDKCGHILLFGFIIPFFAVPIAYYRIRKNKMTKPDPPDKP